LAGQLHELQVSHRVKGHAQPIRDEEGQEAVLKLEGGVVIRENDRKFPEITV
jgi:hypothetical protein